MSAKFKLSKEKKRELNKLVDDRSLTATEMEKARKAINTIVKELKKALASSDVNVDRVFKGGSWNKGTILRDDCEVDLVVFINCISLQHFTESTENVLHHVGDYFMDLPNILVLRETASSLTFRYKMVRFNIMVAYNAVENRTTENLVKEQRDSCLAALQDSPFSHSHIQACFVESSCSLLQRRNVESDQVLTRAIKLIKIWNNTCFEQDISNKTQLSSCALEILMAHLYDTHKSINAPFMFFYAMEMLANLDTNYVSISLSDFVTVPEMETTRPMRIFDPCLAYDLVQDFESWRSLICIAKKTLKATTQVSPLDNVFFLPKEREKRSPGHSPDVSNSESSDGETETKTQITEISTLTNTIEKLSCDIKETQTTYIQMHADAAGHTSREIEKLAVELRENITSHGNAVAQTNKEFEKLSTEVRDTITATSQMHSDTVEQINKNIEKLSTEVMTLAAALTEHKFLQTIFYHSLLDLNKQPKIDFTCQRHGGVITQVQVIGDLVVVEGGGAEQHTCDLWATPAGLGNWNPSMEGAKPLVPVKLDFTIGGEDGSVWCMSVQEEGMRVQKKKNSTNVAGCGKWRAFYSKTKPGLVGIF